jgi:vitamin B12 transporter
VQIVGDSFDDVANRVRLDGYALAQLRAELPLGERLVLYGRVDNLGDARYQTVAGYGVLGRAAYGGLRLRFE